MQIVSHQNIAAGTAVPSAETVLAATAAGLTAQPGARVLIQGVVNLLAGAGTTAVVLKIRRGGTTGGAQVGGNFPITLAAAANGGIAFAVEDPVGWLSQAGGGQYCVTLTQTGGTGNGSVNQGNLNIELIQ